MRNQAVVTVQIVGWNSAKTLPAAVRALADLPAGLAVVRYIDNASSDGSAEIVEKAGLGADVIRLNKNVGFTGAHNIGLSRCNTPFLFTHDPDLVLNPDALAKLVDVMQAYPRLGAVQGLLLRGTPNNVVDSAGVSLSRAFNGIERGANEINQGQFAKPADVSATTGAASLYRVEALRAVRHGEAEYFDGDFFAYKDDVDLGWRLRRGGWRVRYEPVVIGRHLRTLGKRGQLGWSLNPRDFYARLRNPRTRYSLRNWVWMLAKNLSKEELENAWLFIGLRALVWVGLSMVYWPLSVTIGEALAGIPAMLKKRSI